MPKSMPMSISHSKELRTCHRERILENTSIKVPTLMEQPRNQGSSPKKYGRDIPYESSYMILDAKLFGL